MKARFIYRAWKARLRDQRLEIAIARAFIKPGDLVIDAGANKGAYLYWLRRSTGPQGAVLAYEPQPALAEYLQKISGAMGWTNVQVRAMALSNHSGKSMLHVPGSGISPGASLESSVLDHMAGSRLECVVGTLDHQLEGKARLGFLKVDVEGHELALFQGAEQSLRKHSPPLLFECEARHLSKHSMHDVFSFLQGLGYTGYLLCGDALLTVEQFDPAVHQAQNVPQFWNEPTYYNNFLFVVGALPSTLPVTAK
jgi:FkbM family methyltransferase